MSTHGPLCWIETAGVRDALNNIDWETWRNTCVEFELFPVMYGWQLGHSNVLIQYAEFAAHWPPSKPFRCSVKVKEEALAHIEELGLYGQQRAYFAQVLIASAARYTTMLPRAQMPDSAFMEDVDVLTGAMFAEVLNIVCLGDTHAFDCIGSWLCKTLVAGKLRRDVIHAAVRVNGTCDINAYTEHAERALRNITDALPLDERPVLHASACEANECKANVWIIKLVSRTTIRCADPVSHDS